MTKLEQFYQHLLTNGKNMSWFELGRAFDFKDSEAARTAWRIYKKNHNLKDSVPMGLVVPPSRVMNPVARQDKEKYTMSLEDKITRFEEDLTKGTAQVEALVGQEIKTLDELVQKCNIDLTKWQITRWVQNFWNNKYQVKAFLAPKEEKNKFQENFVEFLKTYVPTTPVAPSIELDPKVLDEVFIGQRDTPFKIPKGCLVISKQDLHFNKHDIYGKNDIHSRFRSYEEAIERIIHKALLSYNVQRIVYLIGSDEFNSEWTGMTTKGTPQQNMIGYHEGFAAICDHEVTVIKRLAAAGREVSVIYMPGNHDEYVGWHMVTWLATFFKDASNIKWDVSTSYRKYVKYNNTAMMFNHGDVVKPQKLASLFPQEFKDHWSSCEYQYIFTGDKHHELALEMDGIIFYQLTQGSSAKSLWDDKNGYISRGFLTAFVISENWGLADTYKERL